MSKYASVTFWTDTFDRAVATFAQSAVGALAIDSMGILDVDWTGVMSVAGLAGIVSVLTSVSFRGKPAESETGK